MPSNNSPPLADGADVLRALKDQGGLDSTPSGYDRAIEDEIRATLFPGSKRTLQSELAEANTTTEEFLDAFFHVVLPFVLMWQEILSFFTHVNARKGDHNLKIAFHFDRASAELALTLERFRELSEQLVRVVRPHKVRRWNHDQIWEIRRGILDHLPNPNLFNEIPDFPEFQSAREWLATYNAGDWPVVPKLPWLDATRAPEDWINEVENLIRDYVAACADFWADRDAFRSAYESKSTRNVTEVQAFHPLPMRDLAQAETDFWPRGMLTGLAQAVAQLGGPHSSDQDQARRAMREAVMGVLDRIPTEIRQRPELERSFLDFINLPVWKRRHEVYAVWVGTRIGKAIDPWEPHYQPDGDVLRFPFSGARLASLSANAEPLEFWTELRTSLQKPVSGKRKGSIQPDYRIAAVPVKTPESSKLVVECKQYKKASAANFSNALNDYASGCPNAAVLLVNYGPVTDRVRVHVREDFRDRTHVIPYFRPRNFAVLEEFSLCVSGAISPLGASGSGLKGGSGRVVLRWSGRLEDLDLYIGIPNHEGKSYLVYYMAQNQGDAEPFMRLSPDIRQGPGLERVDVAQWMPCIYEIYVHNFSRIGVMTNDATVTVSTLPGAPLHMFRCHAEGSGAWWHVCSIDGASGRITKVDRLEGVPSALPGIGP